MCEPIPVEGEHVEMGGVIDPEKGAVHYRRTTQVEVAETDVGSEFSQKKIKKVTSETSWLGKSKKPDKEPLVREEVKPWQDDEIEQNPLYSSSDYVSDFNNPLYSNRLSAAEGAAIAASGSFDESDKGLLLKDKGRASRGRPGSGDKGQQYVDYLSAQPGEVDTLF